MSILYKTKTILTDNKSFGIHISNCPNNPKWIVNALKCANLKKVLLNHL